MKFLKKKGIDLELPYFNLYLPTYLFYLQLRPCAASFQAHALVAQIMVGTPPHLFDSLLQRQGILARFLFYFRYIPFDFTHLWVAIY